MKVDQGSIQKWFIQDESGGLNGPFTPNQIIEFVQAGKIKVEAEIYSAENNLWIKAYEIIPKLDSPNLEPIQETKPPVEPEVPSEILKEPTASILWSAPPKPSIFKETHVVSLNDDPTEQVDYFALLNQHRSEQKETKKPSRAPETPEQEDFADAIKDILSPFYKNRKLILAGAATLLVTIGVWGIVKNLLPEKNREIAQEKNNEKATTQPPPPPAAEARPAGIGSGQNIVQKKQKSVSRLNYNKLMEQSQNQNQIGISPPSPTPEQEPAQYISTSEPEIVTEPPAAVSQPIEAPPTEVLPNEALPLVTPPSTPLGIPNMPGAVPGAAPGLIPPAQPNMPPYPSDPSLPYPNDPAQQPEQYQEQSTPPPQDTNSIDANNQ